MYFVDDIEKQRKQVLGKNPMGKAVRLAQEEAYPDGVPPEAKPGGPRPAKRTAVRRDKPEQEEDDVDTSPSSAKRAEKRRKQARDESEVKRGKKRENIEDFMDEEDDSIEVKPRRLKSEPRKLKKKSPPTPSSDTDAMNARKERKRMIKAAPDTPEKKVEKRRILSSVKTSPSGALPRQKKQQPERQDEQDEQAECTLLMNAMMRK